MPKKMWARNGSFFGVFSFSRVSRRGKKGIWGRNAGNSPVLGRFVLGERERGVERERERERKKERRRKERKRGKERGKQRERNRERETERGKQREGNRERERERQIEREKEREREREREGGYQDRSQSLRINIPGRLVFWLGGGC